MEAIGETVMKRAMIIQPMAGRQRDQIKFAKAKATRALERDGYEVVNTLFGDDLGDKVSNSSVAYLAESIRCMADVHLVYVCSGWEQARGCRIEHQIAKDYGIEVRYEGS